MKNFLQVHQVIDNKIYRLAFDASRILSFIEFICDDKIHTVISTDIPMLENIFVTETYEQIKNDLQIN